MLRTSTVEYQTKGVIRISITRPQKLGFRRAGPPCTVCWGLQIHLEIQITDKFLPVEVDQGIYIFAIFNGKETTPCSTKSYRHVPRLERLAKRGDRLDAELVDVVHGLEVVALGGEAAPLISAKSIKA